MKIFRKVLIYSVIVYITGIALGPLSVLIFPSTVFRWKESLQISTPALFLIGILYTHQILLWNTYKYLLLCFGLVSLILYLFQVIPAIVLVLIILALAGIFMSYSPKFRKIISAVQSAV